MLPGFGYKLHLIVDANYEQTVAFRVTQASKSKVKQARDLIDDLDSTKLEVLEACETLMGDRGLDDGKLISKFWDDHCNEVRIHSSIGYQPPIE